MGSGPIGQKGQSDPKILAHLLCGLRIPFFGILHIFNVLLNMSRKYLIYINIGLAVVASILALFMFRMAFKVIIGPEGSLPPPQTREVRKLPRNPFEQPSEAYEGIADPLLTLHREPPRLTLPDLRSVLTYVGSNARPDADPEKTVLHFLLKGDTSPIAVVPDQPLFLLYDQEKQPQIAKGDS